VSRREHKPQFQTECGERGGGPNHDEHTVAVRPTPSFTALGLTLWLALSPAHLGAQQGREPDFDALAREATERLSEYLRVKTVNPPGNETAGARWLKDLLAREGIESEIFESSPGRGNLYARIRGNGKKRPLILLSHIDVVPVNAGTWTVDPWSGMVRDGYVWGRGALDMKGEAVMGIMAAIALKRRGVPLSRDLIIIANADEETNSTGAEWFAREKAELIRDAEFLINEGGSNRDQEGGKTQYYGAAVTEKVPFWLTLTVRGSPGHGSVPRPDNAAARLSRVLGRIADYQPPFQVTPPAVRYFKDLSTREADPRRRRWLADPASAVRDSGGAAFFTSNLYYNALLRNTISITGMRGSDKTNVIPAEATAHLDIRLLPGISPSDFLPELRRVIADSTVEITPLRPDRKASTSPLSGELVEAVRHTVNRMEPGALITTQMLTGFTDSYYYRALGIAAYGLSPFRLSEADSRTVHGNDERVSLENIRFGVEFYYRIAERVAR
jgi:acetylornithine deacetylase/succinyl-diaminopimelate desuccinylase-like protein